MIIIEETLKYLGIAFVCSAALIVVSKIILQYLIRRPADYYDADELRQEELMLNAGGISITAEHTTGPDGVVTDEPLIPWAENEVSETRRRRAEATRRRRLAASKLHHRLINELSDNEIPKVENPVPETPAIETPVTESPVPETQVAEKTANIDKESIRKQLEKAFDDKIKTVKPSMKLRKSELKAIAEYRGLEIPEKATKQIILDLIKAQEDNKEE